MIITNERLLSGLKGAVAALGAQRLDAATQQILGSANALIDELYLREQRGFYVDYLQRGAGLLRRFQALDAGARGEPAHTEGAISSVGSLCEQIEQTRRSLLPYASVFHEASAAQREACIEIFAWEAEWYRRTPPLDTQRPGGEQRPLTQSALQSYLRSKLSDPALEVTEFKPLIGGLQKLTVLFEIEGAGGHDSMVLRGEHPDRFLPLDLGDVAAEYEIIKIAFDAGLPVPEPLWIESDSRPVGRRFLVSRKAQGDNYGSAVSVAAMPQPIARAFVTALARMHMIPIDRYFDRIARTPLARWLRLTDLAENTRENIRYWCEMLDAEPHASSPALSAVQSWLIKNVPAEEGRTALIHCDYGPHNALIQDGRISAILDWESARIGDPAEDLSYLLQRMAPQVDPADGLRWYHEAGGPYISESRLKYFDVFHVQKLITACLAAQSLYARDGAARNEWTALAFKHMQVPLSMPWQSLIANAEARERQPG